MSSALSTLPTEPPKLRRMSVWIFPILILSTAYGLLGLTQIQQPNHAALMTRCVLMDDKLARIWSVAHVEIGFAYFGIFAGMAYYLLQASKQDKTHLRDLGLGFLYLIGSFALDYLCVRSLKPLPALLVGDAIVMTFTLAVSRQLWFQRLLGIFVPLVFLSCGLGHSLEGLSYWNRTYDLNVPWTMVTADIGFAVLLNAARFPAFIRGSDIVSDLEEVKQKAHERHLFLRDVLRIATENKLYFCADRDELPSPLPQVGNTIALRSLDDVSVARKTGTQTARDCGYGESVTQAAQYVIGEAAVNAVRHGGGGTIRFGGDETAFQIVIEDSGTGIPLHLLPRAVLEPGFSTAQTAGQGFMLMLNFADRTDLLTGNDGTIIVFLLRKNGLGK